MPIVKATDSNVSPVKPSIPKIHKKDFSSNVVDTKYNPLSSLLTYVSGSNWTVDYYSQVIDTDTALAGQDIGQSGIYQQYRVIRKLDLKVANALTWTQDTTSRSFIANGAAHVHSLVIPNVGDMFLADVGDGREGVFQVSSSEKKSLFKEAVFYIEYQLVYYSDNSEERRKDLDSKVVQELHYLKDFLKNGQNPLVTTEEYNAIDDLQTRYAELINHYFRWFFSNEYKTLIVPGQPNSVYDHSVVEFLSSILNTRDNEKLRYMRRLNVDDDYYLKEPNLFKALLTRDVTALRTGYIKTGLVSTKLFNKNPMLEGIRFSNIEYVVYPKDHTLVYDSDNNKLKMKLVSDAVLVPVPTRTGNLSDIIYDTVLDFNSKAIKLINSVLADDYYVLSQNFYENLDNKTLLEVLVGYYFKEEKIDPVVLLKLTNNSFNWGGLERFYYIPLLLMLIKNVIGDI
jgi:hypothetical protein